MPSVLLPAASAPASRVGPAYLMLERAERLFRRSPHAVSHVLRLSADGAWTDRASAGKHTRFVPCTWGVRQDDYRWRVSRGDRDGAAWHDAASAAGWALVHAPLPGWEELLPGSMAELMGKQSDLYLADYWLLTLHYLVWSKRLPYPIRARWTRGSSVQDACFEFISKLPAGVVEASLDALILFREAAVLSSAPCDTAQEPEQRAGLARMTPAEPPVRRDGRWCMAACAITSARPLQPQADSQTPSGLPALPELPNETAEPTPEASMQPMALEDGVLELDDQSFTARCGGQVCRFASRNKQLFALLERINRRPGHRVSFEDLCAPSDVWDGLIVEDSTIRGAVARLRKLLKQHQMESLAARISTGSYRGSRYVVLRSPADQDY